MTDPFSPYRDAVVRSLERRFGSRELAEDAVQDALAIALAGQEAPANPKAWLHVVAHRRAVDVIRGAREAPHADPPEVGSQCDPLDVLALRERVRSVLGALHGIPVRQRDALLLRSLEGRTYDEIGARLDVAPENAKQLVSRARRSLCLTVAADGIDCAAVRRELEHAVEHNSRAPVLVRPHLRECRDCARCHAELRRAARRRRLGALVPVPLFVRLGDVLQRSFEVATGTAAGRACAGVCVAGALATFGPPTEVVRQVARAPAATATPTAEPTPEPKRKRKRTPAPEPTPVTTVAATPVATFTPAPVTPPAATATPAPEPDHTPRPERTPEPMATASPSDPARARAASVHAEFEACRRASGGASACVDQAREAHTRDAVDPEADEALHRR